MSYLNHQKGICRPQVEQGNGNLDSVLTATLTNTYEWDAANRLTTLNRGVNRSEFTYDWLGRRTRIVEKRNGDVVSTRTFVWCGTELCEERDATGGTVTKRFFGQGEETRGTDYVFTRDLVGSATWVAARHDRRRSRDWALRRSRYWRTGRRPATEECSRRSQLAAPSSRGAFAEPQQR